MAKRLDFTRATTDDLSDVFAIIDLTGWGETLTDIRLALMNPHNTYITVYDPESGEFIGIVLAVNLGSVGFIGHVVVRPSYRNMGIGQELMNEAIQLLTSEGCKTIKLDAVPKAKTLYERVGFRVEATSYRYRLDLSSPSDLPAILATLPQKKAEVVVSPTRADELAKIIEIDREIFGANREPFLFSLFDEWPKYAFLARNAEHLIVGYLFGSYQHGLLQLRAGISDSQETTMALLRAALQQASAEPDLKAVKIGFLENSLTAPAAMALFGFHEQSYSYRMVWGEKSSATTNPSIFAIGDPAKG